MTNADVVGANGNSITVAARRAQGAIQKVPFFAAYPE